MARSILSFLLFLCLALWKAIAGTVFYIGHAFVLFYKVVWYITTGFASLVIRLTTFEKFPTDYEGAQYSALRYVFRVFFLAFVPLIPVISTLMPPITVVATLIAIDQSTIPDFSVDRRFVQIAQDINGKKPTVADIGATLMTSTYHQLESELDSFLGWTVNDVFGLQFWDNRTNRQRGVWYASGQLLEAMSKAISKFGSTDEESPLLVEARSSYFSISPHKWMFPDAESEYRSGIQLIRQYQKEIRSERARARINITNTDIETILNVLNEILDQPHGGLNTRTYDVPWTELDDRVFYAQGVSIVVRDALVALRYAFADKIEAAGAMPNMEQAISSLEGAIDFHPIFITQGDGKDWWNKASDDRSKMSRYITDARTRIVDVARAIQR